MDNNILLLLAVITVSWVMFVFNFVLGYYIGRIVEAAERKKEKNHSKVVQKEKTKYKPFSIPSVSVS